MRFSGIAALFSAGFATLASSHPFEKRSEYRQFWGDGSPAQGWPTMDQWTSFDNMWDANQGIMQNSCTYWHKNNNSPVEQAAIRRSIDFWAEQTGVDRRVILAVIIQESKGCVRVDSTAAEFTNPGLMQTFNGKGRWTENTPCPPEVIHQMIQDGTAGVGGVGLKPLLDGFPVHDAMAYYRTARIYNTGHITNPLEAWDQWGTRCYSSDIANRLTGWNGDMSPCHV